MRVPFYFPYCRAGTHSLFRLVACVALSLSCPLLLSLSFSGESDSESERKHEMESGCERNREGGSERELSLILSRARSLSLSLSRSLLLCRSLAFACSCSVSFSIFPSLLIDIHPLTHSLFCSLSNLFKHLFSLKQSFFLSRSLYVSRNMDECGCPGVHVHHSRIPKKMTPILALCLPATARPVQSN